MTASLDRSVAHKIAALLLLCALAVPMLGASAPVEHSAPAAGQPTLTCGSGVQKRYDLRQSGHYKIHQEGPTIWAGGEQSATLCVEGPHHQCWPLPNTGALSDITDKELSNTDQLVLWRTVRGASGETLATNCPGNTGVARFQGGEFDAKFTVTNTGP